MVTVAFCLSEMDWLLDLDLSNLEVMKATVRDCQCYRHRPSFWSDRLQPGPMPDGLMTDSNRKWNLLPLYCHFPLDKFSKGNDFLESTASLHCPNMCVVLILGLGAGLVLILRFTTTVFETHIWLLFKSRLSYRINFNQACRCGNYSWILHSYIYIRLSFNRIIFFLFFLDQQAWKYWYQIQILLIMFWVSSFKYFLNNLPVVMCGFFFAKLVKAKFSWKEPSMNVVHFRKLLNWSLILFNWICEILVVQYM